MSDFTELVALLDELGPALLSADDSAGLTTLCEVTHLSLSAAACSVAVIDESAGELSYLAAAGAGAAHIIGTRLALGRGLAGYVASSGQALSISDVTRDARFAADIAESTGYVPSALLVVPIAHADATLGVLSVLDAGRADMTLAAGFASLAASMLFRATTNAGLGHTVASTLAAAGSGDLADELRNAAENSIGASADLAELAALYVELAALGTESRAAATRIVAQFTAHIAGSQQRTSLRRVRR